MTSRAAPLDDAYTGVENLEVMAEAVNYNRYLASLIRRELKAGDKVLDFGAGAGTFALPLVQDGVDLACVEPDAGLLARLHGLGARAVANIDAIPPDSIDFAYSFNVLEHIADDLAAARALAGRLKPGGRLLVYVPAFQILYSAMDRKVGHHRRYRRGPLVRLLREAGLRIVDARYADSLGFPAALLYRVIGGEAGEINRTSLKIYDRLAFPLSRLGDALLHPWIGKNLVVRAVRP